MYVVNTLLQNSFSNTYLSRYSAISLSYQCLNPDTISLGIDINRKLVTIFVKSKGMILNLFIKTGNHTETILWSINATATGRDLVSYQYQWEACNYRFQIKGDDPQTVY